MEYFGKKYSGELITFPNVSGMILSTKYSGAYDAFKAKVEKSPEILSPDEVRALTNALRGYQADQSERERHSTNIQSRMF